MRTRKAWPVSTPWCPRSEEAVCTQPCLTSPRSPLFSALLLQVWTAFAFACLWLSAVSLSQHTHEGWTRNEPRRSTPLEVSIASSGSHSQSQVPPSLPVSPSTASPGDLPSPPVYRSALLLHIGLLVPRQPNFNVYTNGCLGECEQIIGAEWRGLMVRHCSLSHLQSSGVRPGASDSR